MSGNRPDSGTTGVRFQYSSLETLICTCFAGIAVGLAAFMVRVAAADRAMPSILAACLLILGGMLGVLMTLSRLSITIDDTKIFASLFGMKAARIPWQGVARIKRIRTAYLGTTSDAIQIQNRTFKKTMAFVPNVYGYITFSHRIEGYAELVERINLNANRHNIPLMVMDLRSSHIGGKARNQEVSVKRFDLSEP
jgi:hypothetical protein